MARRSVLATMVSAVLSAAASLGLGTVPAHPAHPATAAQPTGRVVRAAVTTTATYPDAVTLQENAARDGNAGPTNLPATLQRSWSMTFQQRISYAVIAGGRVFVTVSRSPSAPSTTAPEVYAYDGATGQRLWGPYVVPGKNADFASLAYDAGRLFVVSQEGFVAALQPSTGAQIWSRTLVWSGGQWVDPPIARAGHLYEVSSTSGVLVWSINETNGVLDMLNLADNGPGGFAMDASGFYVDQGNGVSALTPSGGQRWRQQDDYQDFGNGLPVLHAGQMWIRSKPQQHILKASTGDLIGSFASDTPPAFAGNTVVQMRGSTLTAADATTLARRWTQKGDGKLDTDPVIAGSVVYVGSASGAVFGYSLATGTQVWQGQTGAPVSGTDAVASPAVVLQNPTIGDGLLAVPSGNRLTVFGAAAAPPPAPGWSVRPVAPVVTPPTATVTYPDAVAFQENAAHDGYAGPALPSTLHQRWSHTFGGIAGSPLIVAGRMFVPVLAPGATDVYAYSASTGARLWGPVAVPDNTGWLNQSTPGGGVAYDGGRLFVLSGSGVLKALSPTTGSVLWTTSFQRDPPSTINWPGAPVAYGGRVYAVGDERLQIVSETTGAGINGVEIGDWPWSIPAANSRGVFVNMPADDAELFSPTGQPVWHNDTGSGGGGGTAAVLHGTQVWVRTAFVGGDGQVLDQATGKVVRSFDSDTPPAFAGSYGVLSDRGTLTGINATTGATAWSEAGDAFLDSPPVIAGRTAYVMSRLGIVFGFDIVTGVQTWRAPLPGTAGYSDTSYIGFPFDTGPAIGDGYLAVPSAGGVLTVFGR